MITVLEVLGEEDRALPACLENLLPCARHRKRVYSRSVRSGKEQMRYDRRGRMDGPPYLRVRIHLRYAMVRHFEQ